MPKHAKSTFEVKNWDEKTTSEAPEGEGKITRASVVFAYHGDLEAEGAMEYLMAYGEGGSAIVIGLERITGSLGGKQGSFVLKHDGGYASGTAKGEFSVIDGSGTGDLSSITGKGRTIAQHEGKMTAELEYELGT
jgi:hypothetical protein